VIVINPFGMEYYRYLWHALTLPRPQIPEWRSLLESFPSVISVTFLLSLVWTLWLAFRIGLHRMHGVALLAATAAAAALHQRMLPFYAIAWIAYMPGWIRRTPRVLRRPMIMQAVWMGVAVFFLSALVSYRPWELRVPSAPGTDGIAYPVDAVSYLSKVGFRGNAMVPFSYGAYVLWNLYPAVHVSVDSRYEVAYPAVWVDECLRMYRAAPGWERTLSKYPTDILLVAVADPLARAIQQTAWRQIYADNQYEIYARPDP